MKRAMRFGAWPERLEARGIEPRSRSS